MKNRFYKFFKKIKETFLHVGWLMVFLIPIFGLMNFAMILLINSQTNAIKQQLETTAELEINNIDLYINTQIDVIKNDLFVIVDSNEVSTYLNDQTAINFTEVQSLIYRITTNKPNFIHAKIADLDGNIVYQASRDDDAVTSSTTGLGSISDQEYYPYLNQLSDHQIYLSGLHMIGDRPAITLVTPIMKNDQIIYYVMVDYDADSFLFVFGLYSQEDLQYLSLGLINSNVVWLVDAQDNNIHIVSDPEIISSVTQNINNNFNIYSATFDIRKNIEDFLISEQTVVVLFMQYDLNLAISNSNYFLLNNTWIISIANILLLIVFAYIAYMLRSKNEAQLLINANTYLSAQNENAILISDRLFRATYVNHAFERIYGYPFKEIENKHIQKLLQIEELYSEFNMNNQEQMAMNMWNKTKSDIYLLKYLRIKRQVAFGQRDPHYIGIFSEPHIEFENYLAFIKNKDEETKDLKKLLSIYPFNTHTSTLMMIKINNGDTYHFATFLKSKLSTNYMVSIPKNNHVMIYVNVSDIEFEQMIEQIDDLIDYFRYLPRTDRAFSHYFSIARASEEINTIESLIDAMITALSSIDNVHLKHLIYDQSLKKTVTQKHLIYEALEDAFKHQEFYLNYQIQMDINTSKYFGAEALLRWKNNQLGQVYPDQFIPVIENSYFINRLSLMVLELAIKDMEKYIDQLPDDFRISINLSSFDFSNYYMINQLLGLIDKYDMPTSRFTFEITESIYIDNIKMTNDVMQRLHEKDIHVAIDDFGTGYSSINSLKSIDADIVKTDRQFMMGYPEHDDGKTLKRMIDIIHGIGKEVIVEGTETAEQIAFCRANQVSYAQGYYISKPIPIQEMIEKFFRKSI